MFFGGFSLFRKQSVGGFFGGMAEETHKAGAASRTELTRIQFARMLQWLCSDYRTRTRPISVHRAKRGAATATRGVVRPFNK